MGSSDTILWTFAVFAFAFGAAWGSFLNVVVYRLPQKLSLVRPGSFCPHCETPIKPYDNVPIFGWLWLRGRCRACRAPISFRYPGVELLVAVLSLGLAIKVFGGRTDALMGGRVALLDLLTAYILLFAFVAALVTLFFIDLDVTELPPEITLPGILLGLFYGWAIPEMGIFWDLTPNVTFVDALLGAVIGGGVIIVLLMSYFLLTGRIGLGGGDVWMMAMVGAWVGWQGLLFIYLASSVQGILVALVAHIFGKQGSELFRNEQVEALERELGVRDGEPDSDEEGSGEAAPDESTPDAVSAEPDSAPEFGKLAVPFGPFIAVSAVEYVFLGHLLLPLVTGGVLAPNGWLV